MFAKIRKLEVTGFRGSAGTLVVDFAKRNMRDPASALIVGDNGTGKSTICDAIELALQGTFLRGHGLSSPSLPYVLSMAETNEAEIRIALGNGEVIKKRVWRDEFDQLHADPAPHPKFGLTPIVLRRRDILAFLNSTVEQRQIFFFDYFRGVMEDAKSIPKDDFETLTLKKIKLKRRRQELWARLACELRVPQEDIPTIPKEFRSFVTQFVYKGLKGSDRTRALEAGRLHIRPVVKQLLAEQGELDEAIKELDGRIAHIKNRYRLARPEMLTRIKKFVDAAATDLTRSFIDLSNARDFVDRIEIVHGGITEVSLEIQLVLRNGKRCTAHQILSEANLDLVALLMFVSIARQAAERGQEKVLVLDDVLQSVDSVIRLQFIERLLRDLPDWQFIITVHDRMWQNQLRDVFRRQGTPFVEKLLSRWRFESGPTVLEASADLDDRVTAAAERGEVESACGLCGLLLESVCQRASWVLGTSVTRRKDDKYTLGDLWPGIAKKLKKTNVAAVSAEVDRWLHLRNLVGAHYNEWAYSLSLNEVESFCKSACDLYESFFCKACGSWVEAAAAEVYACRCGITAISKV